MNVEQKGQLALVLFALQRDFYHPMGEIALSGFVAENTMLLPEAQLQARQPLPEGTVWGKEWQYAWMFGEITVPQEAKGKRIVMVDDSIVRGTTSANIINMLREAGATEVHVRISSPPFINPCYYGTDIDSKDKLIACKMSVDEIRQKIGADSLGYLSLEGVKKIAQCTTGCNVCTACFDGIYPAGIPSQKENKYDKFNYHINEKR